MVQRTLRFRCMLMGSLGERLREERKALGLSQHDFAAIGGVEANAQGKYESGRRQPRSDYLAALGIKGVDVLYLLSGMRTPLSVGALSDPERAILTHYRGLTLLDQGALSQLAHSLFECVLAPA